MGAGAHPLAALGDLNKFKVAELKDFWKQEGLPVSGKKAELVQRLQEHIDAASGREPTPEVPSAAGDDENDNSVPEEESSNQEKQSEENSESQDQNEEEEIIRNEPE